MNFGIIIGWIYSPISLSASFYPDSRYLPARIISALHDAGIPDTCIHYTVSKFRTSSFTHEYHYGDLMAVPCIIKPLYDYRNDQDWERIGALKSEYEQTEAAKLDAYATEKESVRQIAA